MNKKAFTLIELLAVIVILAIIALIAVPIIINIITDAKIAAFKETANAFVRAGKYYYNRQINENEGMFEFPKDKDKIEIDDKEVTSGNMTITSDGDIMLAISDGTYCARKSYYESSITVDKDLDSCYIYKISGAAKNDGYVTFDGVDDYVDLGLKEYDFGKQFTAIVDFRALSSTSGGYILGNAQASGVNIAINASDLRASIYNGSGYLHTPYVPIELNRWYETAMTFDGTDMIIYLDGKEVTRYTLPQPMSIAKSIMPFYLGANPEVGKPIQLSNIDVSSASIYNRVLMEDEIEKIYVDKEAIPNKEGLLTHIDF